MRETDVPHLQVVKGKVGRKNRKECQRRLAGRLLMNIGGKRS